MCEKSTNIFVIIPVYNCITLLREAVDSVLQQPYTQIKVVIVDDGSTDGTDLLSDQLATQNERVHVIHRENGGISAARNTGIEYVLTGEGKTGDYFAFLDADDCWTLNFFTDDFVKQLTDADVYRFQSVGCNYPLSRRMKTVELSAGTFDGGPKTVRQFLQPHIGAALYSLDFIKEKGIRFILELKYSEDVLFIRTCLYRAKKLVVFNRLLYLYRNNPTSCVHTINKHGFDYYEPMFHAYLKYDFDGKDFISWYLVDCMIDHFGAGGTIATAREWLCHNQTYVEIAKDRGGARANNMLHTFELKPKLFALKYRIAGIAWNTARKIVHTPPISSLLEIVRYPIQRDKE